MTRLPRRYLLLGMMGVGKSAVGRALAAATGGRYLDNDELVRRAAGADLAELASRVGEAGLRAAESAALTVALAEPVPVVAGVAGGVVLDPADRRRLAAARDGGAELVWLRARPETLVARIAGDTEAGKHRPWLAGDPVAVLTAMARERAPLYAEVASCTVDVDARTPAEVVAVILGR